MSVRISENLFYVRISETFCLLNGTEFPHQWTVLIPCMEHKIYGKSDILENEHNHEGLSEIF